MERLPTPQIGTTIWWFDRNNQDNPRAALVTAIEGPGKIKVTIFGPAAMPIHKAGVLHVLSPIHNNGSNSSTVHNGSWNYIGNPSEDEILSAEWEYVDRKIAEIDHQRQQDARMHEEAKRNKEAKEQAVQEAKSKLKAKSAPAKAEPAPA